MARFSIYLFCLLFWVVNFSSYVLANQLKTHYQVLGVNQESTLEDIKKSYRRLAKLYHPDKNKGDPDAEKKFIEVSSAYEVLSDEAQREEYDSFLNTGRRNGRSGGKTGSAAYAQSGGWAAQDLSNFMRRWRGTNNQQQYHHQSHAEMQEMLRKFREQFEHFEQSGGLFYRSADGRMFFSSSSSTGRGFHFQFSSGGRNSNINSKRSWGDFAQDVYRFLLGDSESDYRRHYHRHQQYQQEQDSPLFMRTLFSLVWFTFVFMFVIPILF